MITASKLSLALKCAYSFRDTPSVSPSAPSAAAAYGSALHKIIERTINGEKFDVPQEFLEDFRAWREWWRENAVDSAITIAEPAFAFDPHTAKAFLIGRGIDRAYGAFALPDHIFGSADLICIRRGHADVYDWKTGRVVENAYDSVQLQFLALCVSKIFGCTVTVHQVQIRHGAVAHTWHTYGKLDDFAEKLAELASTAKTSPPRAGAHCQKKYCRLYGACPATTDGPPRKKVVLTSSAKKFMTEFFGAAFDEAIESKISREKIHELVRGKAEKTGLKIEFVEREVISALENFGAIKTTLKVWSEK